MYYIIILFGLLITALSFYILFQPKVALEHVLNRAGSTHLYVLAIGARIGMGLILLLYADQSRFPLTLHILGYLMLVAGIILLLIGRPRFERLVKWAIRTFVNMAWLPATLGVVLGLFLIYAVL